MDSFCFVFVISNKKSNISREERRGDKQTDTPPKNKNKNNYDYSKYIHLRKRFKEKIWFFFLFSCLMVLFVFEFVFEIALILLFKSSGLYYYSFVLISSVSSFIKDLSSLLLIIIIFFVKSIEIDNQRKNEWMKRKTNSLSSYHRHYSRFNFTSLSHHLYLWWYFTSLTYLPTCFLSYTYLIKLVSLSLSLSLSNSLLARINSLLNTNKRSPVNPIFFFYSIYL